MPAHLQFSLTPSTVGLVGGGRASGGCVGFGFGFLGRVRVGAQVGRNPRMSERTHSRANNGVRVLLYDTGSLGICIERCTCWSLSKRRDLVLQNRRDGYPALGLFVVFVLAGFDFIFFGPSIWSWPLWLERGVLEYCR